MMSDGSGTARFNADGSLDFSYSNDGTIQTTSAPVNLPLPLAGYTPTASGITSDGAVIMTGNYDVMGTNIPGPLVLYKVLANPPTLSIAANLGLDGTLNITGSPGDDTVWVDDDITNHRLQVQIDLQLYYFLDSAVHQITARLGDGNDAYHGAHEQLVAPTQFVDGEAGNDTIEGGSGNDTLLGGLGNDLILGGIGDDSLYGNGGKDTLAGEGGRDRIDGGRSNDNLHGDAQDDVLIGGPGSDRLFGEGGDDHFSSADGERDSLYGGSGSDSSDADPGDVLASIETNAT